MTKPLVDIGRKVFFKHPNLPFSVGEWWDTPYKFDKSNLWLLVREGPCLLQLWPEELELRDGRFSNFKAQQFQHSVTFAGNRMSSLKDRSAILGEMVGWANDQGPWSLSYHGHREEALGGAAFVWFDITFTFATVPAAVAFKLRWHGTSIA